MYNLASMFSNFVKLDIEIENVISKLSRVMPTLCNPTQLYFNLMSYQPKKNVKATLKWILVCQYLEWLLQHLTNIFTQVSKLILEILFRCAGKASEPIIL